MQVQNIFAYFLLPVALCIAHVQDTAQPEPIDVEDSLKREFVRTDLNELLFKKLFASRRGEHLEVVKELRKMENYERQYKMITVLAERVFFIIQLSRGILETADFEPGNTSFPEDIKLRDALSNILENTALFGDIILHLPDISHRILNTQQRWNTMIQWSLNFVNRTQHLLDKSTITMIHLVRQELNITTRDPGYFNPYWSTGSGGSKESGEATKKQKRTTKREKREKGPRLTRIEL